ncbi:MAG TPA: Zn-dependent hydrolase [Solirubrobacteraceae bacterium]
MSEQPPQPPEIDAARVLADLRELQRRTGGADGAQRLCWGEGWRDAREFLTELLGEIGLEGRLDAAGNLWCTLPGADGERGALGLGSHIDSVPDGGWLDGALGVMAAVGVLRAWQDAGATPPRALTLIDWADEEGARFGRSLFGSSAAAGRLDPAELAGVRDAQGGSAEEVLAANGVELAAAVRAGEQGAPGGGLAGLDGYLELHIEQGPELERLGRPLAAVDGCVGIERVRLAFSGQASHAGTTPMSDRHDAALAAAELALAAEAIAVALEGRVTTGELALEPNIATAVAGRATVTVDLRHRDREPLATMLEMVRAAAERVAAARGCTVDEIPVWRIEPVAFEQSLVALATEQADGLTMISGALHDAAEVARAGVPTAMLFCPSIGGISHSREEDTAERDLLLAIERFAQLASRALARDV